MSHTQQHLRVSGAEFKRFLDDRLVFPGDATYEDAVIFVDGQDSPGGADIAFEDLSDSALLLVCGGRLPEAPADVPGELIAALTWWRAKRGGDSVGA